MESQPTKDKRWKDHLLRSGVPLEYEVARILCCSDFDIEADFAFLRQDQGHSKEWSIDLNAYWEERRKTYYNFCLHLLIECKYRMPSKSMVFFQYPDEGTPPWISTEVVQIYDQFVPYNLSAEPFGKIAADCPFVYKGIDLHDGGALEEEIRRGMAQLRYAAPQHLLNGLDFCIDGAPSDARPFFLARILVTNAPIYVVNHNIEMAEIMRANDIEDVSLRMETVVMYSNYGPDYEEHIAFTFSDAKKEFLHRARRSDAWQKKKGAERYPFETAEQLILGISSANRYECRPIASLAFITTTTGLPKLLGDIQQACKLSFKRRKKKKIKKEK